MDIRIGPLDHPAVVVLLRGHLAELAGLSPAESVHALGLERLRAADVTFRTAWNGDELLGCAALRQRGA